MQRSLFADIVELLNQRQVYLGVGIAAILENDLDHIDVFAFDCEVERRASIDVASIDISLLV